MKYLVSAFKNTGSSVHIFILEFVPEGDSLSKALNLFFNSTYFIFVAVVNRKLT